MVAATILLPSLLLAGRISPQLIRHLFVIIAFSTIPYVQLAFEIFCIYFLSTKQNQGHHLTTGGYSSGLSPYGISGYFVQAAKSRNYPACSVWLVSLFYLYDAA
jgi:hypothetical protein